MNKSKLLNLLKMEEGFKLDFKLKLSLDLDSDKKEFVKDVIAIANTEGGRGYILYGIEDKTKRIVGLKDLPDNIEERIQQIIAYRSIPPVPVSFERVEIGKKQIGVLTIFKSRQVPHQMMQNGAFYVRRGSTTDVAARHEIAKMLQAQGIISIELVPCYTATLEDLDWELIDLYLGSFPVYQTQKLQLLKALGILEPDNEENGTHPTYGGLLLFGKSPQIFLPHAILDITLEKESFSITGNLLTMLDQFEAKIKHQLPNNYPFEELKEVVANALIHRDYWNTYHFTEVFITSSHIKVSNPRHYDYRADESFKISRMNSWLYSRLLLLTPQTSSVHFGIGLERVKQTFGDQLQIETNSNQSIFEVTLPGTGNY